MKKPDFFILGAPKCGTTSLADWLRDHPKVFMSNPKEPHFFNTDSDHHAVFDMAHYESCFAEANEQHLAVGEGSVWYLVSEVAVQNILEYSPAARFIVCIRNPIEMAVSLHDEIRFAGDEPIADFQEAWSAQEGRRNGTLPPPPVCTDIRKFMYGESCLLGKQLQRLYSQVDSARVKVVVMDDMKRDPRAVYQSVLAFLGVPDDERLEFPPSNPAKERKWHWIRIPQRRLELLKARFDIKRGTGIGRLLNKWNIRERQRLPIQPETKQMLRDYFRDDIRLCAHLLDRDLEHWLQK